MKVHGLGTFWLGRRTSNRHRIVCAMPVLAAREEIRDEAAAPEKPEAAALEARVAAVLEAQVADTRAAVAPGNGSIEDKAPDRVQQGTVASKGITATLACLAALLVGGAAIANLLPNVHGFSLLKFDRFTLPKFDHIAFPSFHRTSAPKPPAVAVAALTEPPKPLRETISVPIIDPAVSSALRDIRSSQEQSTVVLASLTRSASSQQDDLKRISRQLSGLATQMEAMAPITTSSISRMTAGIPYPTSAIVPHPHARARLIRTPHKTEPSLPPPVGPVSVGGAPLSPPPQSAAPTPAPVAVSSAK